MYGEGTSREKGPEEDWEKQEDRTGGRKQSVRGESDGLKAHTGTKHGTEEGREGKGDVEHRLYKISPGQ